jgi:putative endonuclease
MNGAVGREAESYALRYLERQGLTLVERNWRCRGGEIDLIMRDGECWVFVEVRHRSHESFGGAAASITPAKCRRLWHAAGLFLQARGLSDAPCRFDAVLSGRDGALQWLKNVLSE